MRLCHGCIFLALLCAGAVQAQEIRLKAELPALVNSIIAPKGETISAQLMSPFNFKGGFAIDAAAPGVATHSQNAPATTAAAGQPDLTEVKSDFVPGEKIMFFDDFSDMAGDEPPPHWKVRGGSVALKMGEGIRQLTVKSENIRLTPNLKGLPKNFTIETEVKFDNAQDTRSIWYIFDKSWDGPLGAEAALRIILQTRGTAVGVSVRHALNGEVEDIADKAVDVDFSRPVKQAIWIQNGRLRIYINDQRIVDLNQIEMPVLTGAELNAEYGEDRVGYRMVRFAESLPDFSQVISSSGRYVTHGILFDTDSDRLKPESAPVIKGVARGLETNPNLKLLIEGHTDSTGSADHNLDLSKRRAEAVKTVLASQFKIDGSRLTAMGLGSSKPMESNDTPAGRAQNRRVEFVRQ
jgi:OOP family OmpA-OmpF porin